MAGRAKNTWTFLPYAVLTFFMAWSMTAAVREKVGHAAPTLDDAYIHFQYARAFAEGHPMRYFAGAPRSSGATSVLWPLALSPFYALGLKGAQITWAAWLLSFFALAGLAYETHRLTETLTSRAIAICAGLSVLAFGGFQWCAASGMEVVPFAWALARSLRLASEWSEARAVERTSKRFRAIVLATFLMATLRPEGQAYALLVALVVCAFPEKTSILSRARALWPLAFAVATPLFLLATTGTMTSSTARVKLLLGNPYYIFVDASLANAKLLVGTILNGEGWSPEFLPKGSAPFALGGLTASLAAGARKRVPVRGVLVFALGLGMFIPCMYVTFLWNRLRYLWPFATGYLIGVMCLCHLAGELIARFRARFSVLSVVFGGVVVGALFTHFTWVSDDVAQSASGIDRQQATLGRWASDNLPASARIGVNDTGAIAYFGNRETFDIVGLTTPGEAPYWVGGAASRFEHYERMLQSTPNRLPNFFIVYPEWMGCDSLFGPMLNEAVVTDSTILGGRSMRVYVANYALLNTGEKPWTEFPEIVDTLDVADLESEAAHQYDLLGARDGEQIVNESSAPDGHPVVDGGRTNRAHEKFFAKLKPGAPARGLVRLRGDATVHFEVQVEGAKVADFGFADTEWIEAPFDIPREHATSHTQIEIVTTQGVVDVFHYYFAN